MLKRAALFVLALAILAPALQAKVYYVNRGVKYHIGDDRASRSADSEFLDSYPTVGTDWVQAFTVSQEDTVRVSIQNIWGVDDCPYCKAMVAIDDHDMGRLSEENNHKPFDTPPPLSMKVAPGHTYKLRIASRGGDQVDDFAIEGVSIETDHAVVTLLEPGPVMMNKDEPLPRFQEPKPPVSPCEGTKPIEHWLPERDKSRSQMEFGAVALPVARRASAPLNVGEFADFYVFVDASAQGEAVDQFLELLVGEPGSGWVLSFAAGAKSPSVGNIKRKGRYGAGSFPVSAWISGHWNQLRLARCEAGSARLWLNGKELGGALPGTGEGAWPLTLRSGGLVLRAAEKPI